MQGTVALHIGEETSYLRLIEMGISRSRRDRFNLCLRRKRMNALKHLLTERLRSHKHLPLLHTT